MTVIRLLLNDPKIAAFVVALLHGNPDVTDDLVSICYRESLCRPITVHQIDTANDPSDGWRGQVNLGHLRPACQPYRPNVWATRGAFGLSAASHWRYLPACYPPEILDVPIVSAFVAYRKYTGVCQARGIRRGWCHVPSKRRRRGFWRTLRKTARRCIMALQGQHSQP